MGALVQILEKAIYSTLETLTGAQTNVMLLKQNEPIKSTSFDFSDVEVEGECSGLLRVKIETNLLAYMQEMQEANVDMQELVHHIFTTFSKVLENQKNMPKVAFKIHQKSDDKGILKDEKSTFERFFGYKVSLEDSQGVILFCRTPKLMPLFSHEK